jgi:hypothetical protein
MTKVVLPLAMLAFSARAVPHGARLLDDAPRAFLASAPQLIEKPGALGYGALFTKTTAVGMVASTAGVLIGAGLGSLSNNLIAAALPVLLANLFLPPVLTVLAAVLMGNWNDAGRFSFWLPVAGAFAVNAATYIIASLFFVVPWTNPVALLVYTLIDGLLMSGATVGVMALSEKKPPVTVTSFVPGVSDTTFLPLVKAFL